MRSGHPSRSAIPFGLAFRSGICCRRIGPLFRLVVQDVAETFKFVSALEAVLRTALLRTRLKHGATANPRRELEMLLEEQPHLLGVGDPILGEGCFDLSVWFPVEEGMAGTFDLLVD